MKKWHLQLRRSVSDGMSASSNGPSMQQQEMSMIQERTLPSSPGPLYGSSHSKMSGYMKGGLGQPSVRKQLMGTQLMDSSRSLLQWVQSISFVTIAIDHSLHLVFQADTQSPGQLYLPVLICTFFYTLFSVNLYPTEKEYLIPSTSVVLCSLRANT